MIEKLANMGIRVVFGGVNEPDGSRQSGPASRPGEADRGAGEGNRALRRELERLAADIAAAYGELQSRIEVLEINRVPSLDPQG
jgi:hypothetical protein